MALYRNAIPSPNYSSRSGSVRLVVIHTAQGASTYQDLGAYFQGDVEASSHVGIDDTPGVIGEYVPRGGAAWTAASFNSVAVQAELCAWAEWTAAQWAAHPVMLDNCRQWIAEECAAFGIPVRRLSAAEAQAGQAGVCDHAALGSDGGGHWDVGSSFPWDVVLSEEEDDMALSADDKEWITKAINDALRQQFRPEGECYGRVYDADVKAIRATPPHQG